MTKITATRDHFTHSLRIFINGLLHLDVKMDNYNGFQSWLQGSKIKLYFIEIYFKEGEPILLEYDDKDNWESILKLLEEKI